jgi:predicted Zn-dependent peptidase
MLNRSINTLPSGLKVITVNTPNLHCAEIALFVRMGSRYETDTNNGISHFLEHMFFRGTKNYPDSTALITEVENLGGTISAFTYRDHTAFHFHLYPSFIKRGLELFSDIFLNPLFKNIEVEREIILEEYLEDTNEDGIDIDVENASRKLIWGEAEPIAFTIIGKKENINNFAEKDLFEHYNKFFTTNNITLSIAGKLDGIPILEETAHNFGKLPKGEKVTYNCPLYVQSGNKSKYIEHKSSRNELLLSFIGVSELDPDFITLILAKRILDSGMSTRLYNNICNKLGLAYDIEARIDSYSDISVFDIGVSSSPKKVKNITKEILKELALLKTNSITESELEIAKNRYIWELEYSMDNISFLTSWYAGVELFYTPDTFEKRVARVKKVTCDDLNRISRKIFTKDNLFLSIVGKITQNDQKELTKIIEDSDL